MNLIDIEKINIYTMNTDTASVNVAPSIEIKNVLLTNGLKAGIDSAVENLFQSIFGRATLSASNAPS